MLSFKEKIEYLKNQLDIIPDNYADGFKTDVYIFIDDFSEENQLLLFLNQLSSQKKINTWIDKLISRIVMKFDEENESINNFIFDYLMNG